ncbi:MAG: twin-arginine translocase subunit TatC [Fimbriimonadales bacterium]
MAHTVSRNDDDLFMDDGGSIADRRATIIEHLEELRVRLFRSILAVSGGWVVGWFAFDPIFNSLEGLIRDPSIRPPGLKYETVFNSFADAFLLKFKLSLIIGLIIAGPIVIYQLWGFVKPALKRKELKAFRQVVPFTVVLFSLGVALAFFILKPALNWFMGYIVEFNAALYQNPGTFSYFVLKMALAFGIGFQLPLVIWFLAKIELLTSESLWKHWRVAVAIVTVLGFLLTPSGDVISNVALIVPMLLLYFITVFAVRGLERKRRKADAFMRD